MLAAPIIGPGDGVRYGRARVPLLVLFIIASPLGAQANAPAGLTPKSEAVASTLSLVMPGTGYFYAGEPATGLLEMAVLGFGAYAAVDGIRGESRCSAANNIGSQCTGDPGLEATIGIAAVIGGWIYGSYDSGRAAARYNAKHGLSTASLAPLIDHDSRGARFGLSLSLRP